MRFEFSIYSFVVFLIVINLSIGSFSNSFLNFLYKTYHKDLLVARYVVKQYLSQLSSSTLAPTDITITNDCSHHFIAENEVLYSLIRLQKPASILELGHSSGCKTIWIMLALSANQSGKLTTIHSNEMKYLQSFLGSKMKYGNFIKSNISSKIFDRLLATSFDRIVVNLDNTDIYSNLNIISFLHKNIHLRNVLLPSLHVSFHIECSILTLQNRIIQVQSNDNNLCDTKKFMKWIDLLKRNRPFDLTFLSLNSKSYLKSQNIQIIRNNNLGEKELESDIKLQSHPDQNIEILSVFLSLMQQPKLIIISPSSRPEKLKLAFESIKFTYVNHWIIIHDTNPVDFDNLSNGNDDRINSLIDARMNNHGYKGADAASSQKPVFDTRINPKIKEYFINDTGLFGNAQRNFGLDLIPKNSTDVIYFLDDDNIMHRNFWILLHQSSSSKIMTFDRIDCNSRKILLGDQCKKWEIDTCQYLVGRSSIGDFRWELQSRDADGKFIENLCQLNKNNVEYIHLLASYHNGQECSGRDMKDIL